jgi:hypothetical protein
MPCSKSHQEPLLFTDDESRIMVTSTVYIFMYASCLALCFGWTYTQEGRANLGSFSRLSIPGV